MKFREQNKAKRTSLLFSSLDALNGQSKEGEAERGNSGRKKCWRCGSLGVTS